MIIIICCHFYFVLFIMSRLASHIPKIAKCRVLYAVTTALWLVAVLVNCSHMGEPRFTLAVSLEEVHENRGFSASIFISKAVQRL